MRRALALSCTMSVAAALGFEPAGGATTNVVAIENRRHHDNVVIQWNNVALEAVRRTRLGPPIVARALAIVHTCMYDAWAAYAIAIQSIRT